MVGDKFSHILKFIKNIGKAGIRLNREPLFFSVLKQIIFGENDIRSLTATNIRNAVTDIDNFLSISL